MCGNDMCDVVPWKIVAAERSAMPADVRKLYYGLMDDSSYYTMMASGQSYAGNDPVMVAKYTAKLDLVERKLRAVESQYSIRP